MKVYLETLGCRLNEAELQMWRSQLAQKGLEPTSERQDAAVMVINTCAVTGEAARKSRQHIRRLHRDNPRAKLVVSGCYASLQKDEVTTLLGVDLVVDNGDKDRLVEIMLQELDLSSMPQQASEPGSDALFPRHRERAFIKIQDGCRYRCSYCIVTTARGAERSRSRQALIQDVNLIHGQGIQEVVLTGVHVGGYGSDIGSSLFELVHALLVNTQIPRLRFASVEPWDLPEKFFELFDNPRVMPHMHLPLQSGSDSILQRMCRRCRTGDFRALCRKARSSIPGFNITSDIIVGFPGETEDEWQQTLDFVSEMTFGHIHIFSFSAREGTKAAGMPGQIDAMTKKKRSQQLHRLASASKRIQLETEIGTVSKVLLESNRLHASNEGYIYTGYTPNYHRISVTCSEPGLNGAVVTVRAHSISDSTVLQGTLLDQISPPRRLLLEVASMSG